MAETFLILKKLSDNHGKFANMGYNKSHPHTYTVADSQGVVMELMSAIGNYAVNSSILIEGRMLASNSDYFIDASVSSMGIPYAQPVAAPPPPPGISIDKEIMVVLREINLKGNFRQAVGSIFYLPDDALKGQSDIIRAGIKEGKEIAIITDAAYDDLEHYRTFLRQAYGFAKLRNVRLPGEITGTTTITAEHTAPRGPGYMSERDFKKSLDI